jgi:hypothetical protein
MTSGCAVWFSSAGSTSHVASFESGGRGRLLGCEGKLHFLPLIGTERVQEGTRCSHDRLRLGVGGSIRHDPDRVPGPDHVCPEHDLRSSPQ